MKDGAACRVSGDRADVLSAGYVCKKMRRVLDEDTDRLPGPLRKHGSAWIGLTWDEAVRQIGQQVLSIQREHGRDSVAICFGNPTAFDYATVLIGRLLTMTMGTANRYSAASLDGLPHLVTSRLMFGNQLLLPVPDIDRTDLLIIIGANPLVSNGSVLSAPGMPRRLRELKRRGGRLVVVDPRRTETARIADRHLQIRPGSDGILLLGLIHALIQNGLAPSGNWVTDEDLRFLRFLSNRWDSRAVETLTDIPAEQIEELANDLISRERAVCYARLGVAHGPFATATCWLVNVLNTLTGNLDSIGGAMFTRPAVDLIAISRLTRDQGDFGVRSRIHSFPSFGGERPMSTLADEILAEGHGAIRALITVGANLVECVPDSARIRQALPQLQLLACVDPFINETTSMAHYILPPISSLYRDQYPLITSLTALRNTAKYSLPAYDEPPPGPVDWEILSMLQSELARGRRGLHRIIHRNLASVTRRVGPTQMLNAALLVGPYGIRNALWRRPLDLSVLRAQDHGVDFGPLVPMLRRRRVKVRLIPEPIKVEAERMVDALGRAGQPRNGELLLIGRRRRNSMNSGTASFREGASEFESSCLIMHPADACARGLKSGDKARVSSDTAEIVVQVVSSYDIKPGVVSLPHGCSVGWRITSGDGEGLLGPAGANELTSRTLVDHIAGSAVLSAVHVSVTKYEG
ncbi:anaerobic selenocysteine-containing dehydrogenase [Geodermatophilus bullaregiensis]|nr:anaerobic selenocysteine-containing dehydrogenase [Geodermatophilus bullaregiensis]